MPDKRRPDIDWKDERDVEVVRLNIQCMTIAVRLTEILASTGNEPVNRDLPFQLADRVYDFVTFGPGNGPN